MRLKYKVRKRAAEHGDQRWYVWKSRLVYFITAYETAAAAREASLLREGCELVEKLDDVQRRMEEAGLVDKSDPYGWRA